MGEDLWIRLSPGDYRRLAAALDEGTFLSISFNVTRRGTGIFFYSATGFFESIGPHLAPGEDAGELTAVVTLEKKEFFTAGMEPESGEGISWVIDGSLLNTSSKDSGAPEGMLPGDEMLKRLVPSSRVACTLNGETLLFSGRKGAACGSLRISVAVAEGYLSTSWMGEDDRDPEMEKRSRILFGKGGMRKLRSLTAGCIGAGGLGNHFITAAMHLGINRFIIVDSDRLEESNLNRFIGAVKDDAGTYKTDLLKREVLGLHPRGEVQVSHEDFPRGESLSLLQEADLLVSAVDNDQARLLVQVYALATHRPLLDMGAGIYQDSRGRIDEWGGQWRLSLPGGPCLACMGLSPQGEEECAPGGRGYLAGTGITPASIVTLNMTVASQALSIMARYAAGDTFAFRHVKYDERGMQTLRIDESRNPHCPLCGGYGAG